MPYGQHKSQKVRGSVRRSQLITTYGVGALIALESESFIVKGIDYWKDVQPDVHEPRLERQLRVSGFVSPPAEDESKGDVPIGRFPKYYYCPQCRSLDEHGNLTSLFGKTCQRCGMPLVPSRFIVACPRGHLEDFPYRRWVHRGGGGVGHNLSIKAGGATASLDDIVVTCETCGVQRSMEGAFGRDALRGVVKCIGKRPWLGHDDNEECDEMPRVLQRGASNIWFSVSASALSIPPWSDGAFKLLDKGWGLLKNVPDDALEETIINSKLADKGTYTVADLVAAVRLRKEGEADTSETTPEMLRFEEYEALRRGAPERSAGDQFVCRDVGELPPTISRWFSKLAEVRRLREVRALRAFTRIEPPDPADRTRWAQLSADPMDWLPGMEVLGEGVFLTLNEDMLAGWEQRDDVVARCAPIAANYQARFTALGSDPDRQVTPRLLLLHTLAHVLISQLSLECGYPAASLRERLYASERMAGLLIYTAAADSAGSLGGLIAQAAPDRFCDTVLEAMAQAEWCSADPLCIEAGASGVESLNLAACHACCLLPETSCEEMNVLLDRGLLIGVPGNPGLGYFAGGHT
jgi:hypothetical protein